MNNEDEIIEDEIPIEIQKMVIERMEYARNNPASLISEEEFDAYLDEL
jgi:hypothetical protein